MTMNTTPRGGGALETARSEQPINTARARSGERQCQDMIADRRTAQPQRKVHARRCVCADLDATRMRDLWIVREKPVY
jgi:hypothetical protein